MNNRFFTGLFLVGIAAAAVFASRQLAPSAWSDGTLVQGTEGTLTAASEGSLLRAAEGSLLKTAEGSLLKTAEGSLLKTAEGSLLKTAEGSLLRAAEGSLLRAAEGSLLKTAEGSLLKTAEGSLLRAAEGSSPATANGTSSPFLTDDERNNIAVFKSVGPSVVFVTNTQLRRRRFSLNVMEIPRGSGTGFVWHKSGLILTNYHVISGNNTRITITLGSGKSYDAKVVGAAPEKDIALLKIDAPDENLVPIPLGDSSTLSVGRKVLAIGNPFALDTSLSVGVVSALGREIQAVNNRTIKNVIQTDAAINPGNSGGPLLNSMGELVGVNTMIYSPSGASAGIGFAIPVNTLKFIIPQLIEHGRLYRPILGIETFSDYWSGRFKIKGVAIFSVKKGLAADKAGMLGAREDLRGNIHLGDVVVAINNEPVTNNDSLLSLLERFEPGDSVRVTTLRDDSIENFDVVLTAPD